MFYKHSSSGIVIKIGEDSGVWVTDDIVKETTLIPEEAASKEDVFIAENNLRKVLELIDKVADCFEDIILFNKGDVLTIGIDYIYLTQDVRSIDRKAVGVMTSNCPTRTTWEIHIDDKVKQATLTEYKEMLKWMVENGYRDYIT